MGKIKFDVRDSDPDKAVAQANFEQPKPGVYRGKLLEVEDGFAKDDSTGKPDKNRPQLICKYEITDKKAGNGNGAWLWDYISKGESSVWKMDQFLQAFGIATKKKRTGEFDPDDIIGDPCTIRVKADTFQGEYKAKVGAVLAASEDEDPNANDDTVDDDGGEVLDDADDLGGDGSEDTVDDGDDGDVEFPYYDMDELAGMQIAGLKQVADDLQIEPPKAKQANRVALSKWIFENQPAEAPEDDATDDTAEETPEDGYDELETADLKAECKDRGLPTGGSKAALITRLREDDQEEPF